MPKKTRLEKIKSDHRRHHFSFAPVVNDEVSPSEIKKMSTSPQYSLTQSTVQKPLSREITALIDPSEFRLIKLDLLKTTILAAIAFMTEFWLYVRLGQK